MGMFTNDFNTLDVIQADADTRRRSFDALEGAIPGTEVADMNALNARRAGSRFESTNTNDPGSAFADGRRLDEGSELDALNRLSALADGGGSLTDADRSLMDSVSRREGMSARADREATLAGLTARGMGSSGTSLAASLGAGEAAAGRASDANAAMMQGAQARAYDALGGYASLASGRASRRSGEDTSRMSAVDAWNARERDRSSGIDARNTERRRSDEDAATAARQQQFNNRYNVTTARTGTDERDTDRVSNQENTQADRDAAREAAMWDAAGGIVGGGLSAAGAQGMNS